MTRYLTHNGRQPYAPIETGHLPESGRFYAIEPDDTLTADPDLADDPDEEAVDEEALRARFMPEEDC